MESTSVSLLERLRQPEDTAAWDRFVRLYTPLMFHWARRAGLQESDAADLVQDVLTLLLRKMPDFQHNGRQSFRSWLRTVTLNRWRDRWKRIATRPLPTADSHQLDMARENELEHLIDDDYQQALVARVLELMQAEFKPKIWQACWEHSVQGRPAADVATELGMSVGAVYAASCRVLARVRQELDGLLE